MTTPAELDQVRDRVRARYAQAADTVMAGGVPSCGDTRTDEPGTGAGLYSASEQGEVPPMPWRPAWAAATRSRSLTAATARLSLT